MKAKVRETTTKPSKKNPEGVPTFEVAFINEHGTRERLYFQDENEAKRKAAEVNNESARAYNCPEELRLEAVRCTEKLAGRMTLTEAVAFAISHATDYRNAPKISILIQEMLKAKEHRRPSTRKDLRLKLDAVNEVFGERQLHDISQDDIAEWSAELQTDGIARMTVANYLKKASELFNFFMEQHCGKNPVTRTLDRLAIGKHEIYRDVDHFVVSDCRNILDAAVANQFRWYAVLGMFTGIRPTELERLEEKHIKHTKDELIVRLGSDVTKTQMRRVVECHRGDPLGDAVLDWLEGHETPHRIVNGDGRRKKAKLQGAIDRAEGWIHDGLRHTCASYHIAQYKNPIATAYLLGHDKPRLLNAYYRGEATEAEAKEFYALRPAPSAVS